MIEFHQGWMVEVVMVETEFYFTCYSPNGEFLSNKLNYPTLGKAMQAGFTLIDQYFACLALRAVLREVFEENTLSFTEWQSLSKSLDYTARLQFMR